MRAQELLAEIQKLPVEEQRKLLETLKHNIEQPTATTRPLSEAEIDQILLAKGIINEIPVDVEEDEEDFEPIIVEGEPLSETIIEERR